MHRAEAPATRRWYQPVHSLSRSIFLDFFYLIGIRLEEKSDAALRCKQRFMKNREKLFTFLHCDGVPWNNNNAEHAIKAFARLRQVISGTATKKGVEECLTLLSVAETCEYKGFDFLDFLRSGEQDVETFADRNRKYLSHRTASSNQEFLSNEST